MATPVGCAKDGAVRTCATMRKRAQPSQKGNPEGVHPKDGCARLRKIAHEISLLEDAQPSSSSMWIKKQIVGNNNQHSGPEHLGVYIKKVLEKIMPENNKINHRCSKCSGSPAKLTRNGVPLCWHCALGTLEYKSRFPNGIPDEIPPKIEKNAHKSEISGPQTIDWAKMEAEADD